MTYFKHLIIGYQSYEARDINALYDVDADIHCESEQYITRTSATYAFHITNIDCTLARA